MTHVLTFDEADVLIQHKGAQMQIIFNDTTNAEPLPAWQSADDYCNDLLSVAEALVIARKEMDAFIKIVRTAATPAEAESKLAEHFAISHKQAHGILNVGLSEFTSFDFEQAKADIEAKRAWYKNH